MNMKKTNGVQWWSEDKGFYMILMLCLLAIAAAAYVLFVTPQSAQEDPLDGYLYEADDSVTASEPIASVPVTEEPAAEADTVKEAAQAKESTEPEKKAELHFTPPMTGEITRKFSNETLEYDETTKDWRTHEAIDYAGQKGDAVCAVADGTVIAVAEDAIYGKYVEISHAEGMSSFYAGLDDISVQEGDTVSGGSQIAVLGEPMPLEDAQKSHLHFEMRKDEGKLDPEGIL